MSARHRPRPMPSALVRAAGAVVWRFRAGCVAPQPHIGQIIDPADIEVLIVHRPRYNDWSWPKGKTENGELLAAAAVREVEEETGEVIRLGAPLTIQRYRLGSGHIKEVHYWVGRQAGGSAAARVRPPVARAPRKEIDDCRWVSAEEAKTLLTRRGDRRLLTEVTAMAASGALVTEPLLIMRPAETVERERWEGILAERHLTRAGVRQSLDVIDTLSAFGVQGIHSSEWMCAHRSIAPYASAAGLSIRTHAELTEPAVRADATQAVHFLAKLMENLQMPTVVATHRETLPHLIESLRMESPVEVRASYPTEEPWLRPAELLVAHIGAPAAREASDNDSPARNDEAAAAAVVAQTSLTAGGGAAASANGVRARGPVPKPGPYKVVSPGKIAENERAEAPVSSVVVPDVLAVSGARQVVALERHAIPGQMLKAIVSSL